MSSSTSRFVGLKAMADGSLLRLATLHDKQYIVVPIVSAVGDEVWWPANSTVPELVPADVLESAYWSRNNRPIVAGHPHVNGEYVSANDPEILEKYSFGHLFAAKFDDKRVKVEAWFDKNRANEVGPAAIDAINRLESGEQIEVSEGNMVISEAKEGELDGKPYKSVWLSCINDHLAVVSEGACNNKMGCGGPRVNQTKAEKIEMKDPGKGKFKDPSRIEGSEKKNGMLRRMLASMTDALKAAMSGNELRMKLFKVVSDKEMGVDLVYDEDVEAKTFIYRICIKYGSHYDSYEYDYKLYRRSFEVSGNDVTIGDDAVEVEWFEGWRDKTTKETEAELSTSVTVDEPATTCSCHNDGKETTTVSVNAGEKKILVTRLIGASKGFVKEEDRKVFEELSEDRLKSMISVYGGEATTTATPETVAVVPPPTATTPQTETATTATPPPGMSLVSDEELNDIKAAASAYRSQQEQYRSTLVSSLKGAQSAFTEEDMKGMTTVQLEKLATSLGVNEPAAVDYSVRGLSRPAVTEKKDHTPPKSWDIALAERNKNKNQTVTN